MNPPPTRSNTTNTQLSTAISVFHMHFKLPCLPHALKPRYSLTLFPPPTTEATGEDEAEYRPAGRKHPAHPQRRGGRCSQPSEPVTWSLGWFTVRRLAVLQLQICNLVVGAVYSTEVGCNFRSVTCGGVIGRMVALFSQFVTLWKPVASLSVTWVELSQVLHRTTIGCFLGLV